MNSSTNETKNAKSDTNSNVVQFNSDERVLDAASEWLVKLDEGLDDNETQALRSYLIHLSLASNTKHTIP